jgi:hypothetical protein
MVKNVLKVVVLIIVIEFYVLSIQNALRESVYRTKVIAILIINVKMEINVWKENV